jgi:hypothetical protein
MSTSILSFHRKVYNENGKLSLVLERYGSLDLKIIEEIVSRFGSGLVKSPRAQARLPLRSYNH